MGINSTEVAYGFGQMGSAHSQQTANSITPPTGKVIVAIQFLETCSLDVLTPAQVYGEDTFIGIGADAYAATGSEVIDPSVAFPGGITIVGRWTAVSLSANKDSGIICYFGY
jgi:hypothetical protein